MNKTYRSIWNQALGAWVAAPETARTGRSATAGSLEKNSVPPEAQPSQRWHGIAGAIAVVWGLAAAAPAYATCGPVDTLTVSCTGSTVSGHISATDNLILEVAPGASVAPTQGQANVIELTGAGTTVINSGSIDPSFLAGVGPTSGVMISNANRSTVLVNNTATGTIMGASDGLSQPGLAGNAVVVENGTGGITTLVNEGTIGSTALGSNTQKEDIPVITLRGGAKNIVENSGFITGRIALQASNAGNEFHNTGAVNGSISLGAGGAANRFSATTGSYVNAGSGVAGALSPNGILGIDYAAAGIVDGGTLNNGNTLHLTNSSTGNGSGTAGTGSIDANQYLNFNHLEVTGGTWSLTNQLFKAGTINPTVELNGGLLKVGSAGLADASITADGGGLGTLAGGATLSNDISLGTNGLSVVTDADAMTLSGVLAGNGSLTKSGDANLTLTGINTYTGPTNLNGGTLTVGHDAAIGSGALNVGAISTLSGTSTFHLTNAVNLDAQLTLDGSNDITLSGNMTGTGALLKTGAGTLTLNGSSSRSGSTTLVDGTLLLGNNTALGSGTLNITGAGTFLDAANNSGIAIANAIALGANTLTFSGSNQLAVNGDINGAGSLLKSGLATLVLGGNNTFGGGVRLNAGTLVLASSTALGSGALTAAGGIFNNTVSASLDNAVHLLGTLTLNGAQDLVLNGVIDGTGNLAKTGTGTLVLNGNNTYSGNTFLLGGTTTVGRNTAFGTGNITTTNAGLDNNTAVNLTNNFSMLSTLAIGGSADLTLSGMLNGAGGHLAKNGAGTLTLLGSNNYSAGTVLNAGTLAVGQNGSLGSGNLTVGGASTLAAASNGVALSNSIQADSDLTIGGANNLTLNSAINGNGSLTKTGTGTLTLNAANTYSGGTSLNGGTVVLGDNSALGTGAVVANAGNTATTVRNTQTRILNNTFVVDGNLTLDTNSELQLVGALNGSGTLTKTGSDEVLLSAGNFNGDIDVKAGYVTAIAPNALGDLRSASLAAGSGLTVDGNINIGSLSGQGVMRISNGQVSIGGNNLDSVFAGTVTDNGGFNKVGAGVLELAGTSDNTGVNTVSAGTLKVTGALNGSGGLNVGAGATLTGSGSINGATTIADGATLAGYSGQTLSFNSLVLSQNSVADFNLGSPLTGWTELFHVTGPLTMAGTFNIADFGGLGNGVYKLFSYGGSLTDNGVSFGTLPGGVDLSELTLLTGTANQVGLLVGSQNLVIQFWDGVDTSSNGLIEGGSGVWDSSTNNWAHYDGFTNDSWKQQFAVFQGATGTVTVDGQQTVSGMQFMTDGYHLVSGTDGSLNINNRNGTAFAVRTDNGVTATLDLPLTGTGTLNKLDVGTLVLNGVNDYSGGTQLNGGTLVLGSDSAVGTGALSAAAGTTLDSNKAVTLGNAVSTAGALTLAGSHDMTLNGVVSGNGSLLKSGNGILTLGNANTYLGGTALNAGRLVLGVDGALGAGTLTTANGTSLDTLGAVTVANTVDLNGNLLNVGTNDLTLNGSVNGVGSLTMQGISTLTLNGINTFSGGVNLAAGQLRLGNSAALGSETLAVNGVSQLDTSSAMALANNVQLSADLTLDGSKDLTLNGVISGNGCLLKNGNASLTLNGANNFTDGLTLNSGNLTLGNASALGSGQLRVTSTSELDTSSAMTLANDIDVGGTLSIAGSNDLTLNGVLSNNGELIKSGLANLTLGGNNTFAGTLNILSGTLITTHDYALGTPAQIVLADSATLRLGGDASLGQLNGNGSVQVIGNHVLTVDGGAYGGVLSGTGALNKVGFDTLTLSGNNSITGTAEVSTGTLVVDGSLSSSSVTVNSDAILSGRGQLTGALNVADGGTLALQSGQTLKVGSLALNQASIVNTALGAPLAGDPSLISIAGNLTLDGLLNVSDMGGFGAGVYRLMNYSGSLTDNGLTLSTVPIGINPADVQLQTAVRNQVNLVVGGTSNVRIWDGSQVLGNGSIAGGSGVWDASNTNWTNTDGSANQAWNSTFAVFQGKAGTVTVNGTQAVAGLQFASDGYTLNGGTGAQLLFSGPTNVRVDMGNTATLGVSLNGSGSLTKLDGGTLILNGSNSYAGTTTNTTGTLQVGNGGVTGNLGLGAVINNGTLAFNRSDSTVVSNDISGTGTLQHLGRGTTTLTGVSSYTGGTAITAGTLRAGSATALMQNTAYAIAQGATLDLNGYTLTTAQISGAGNVQLGSAEMVVNTAVDQTDSIGGQVSGTGQLTKQGAGTLELNSASDFTGGVDLKQGRINVGNAQGLGTGTLSMDDGTTIGLTANGMTIANDLLMTGTNDPIVDTGANNATWAGTITGTGFLTKQGTGTLTLTSLGNTYTGATDVAQGTLQAGAANTFSSTSAHTVASGAVLDLAGYDQTLASLNNSGTVKLSSNSGATPGTVLKITGAYVGNNGNLGLSTVLGADGSATDKLLLSGASAVASGNTTVHITNAAGLGAQTTGSGIQIIGTENGASLQPGSFTLAGGHVDAGAYEYRLTQTAQAAALQSTLATPTTPTTPTTAYRAEVPLLSALPAQLRQADMAMLGDLRKRTGDEGTEATTSSDSGASRRVWGRILRTDPKISQQGTVNPESSGHLTGFQAGLDLYADHSVKAGIYAGQLEGNMGVKGFASGQERKDVGFNKLRTRYLGVYGSWLDQSGLYADAVLQGAEYRSDLSTTGDAAHARTKGNGWLASLEMGQAFALGRNWYIEPQAQIIYRKLSIDDTALSLATVKNQTDGDWTLRLGARIKGSFTTSAGVLQSYGRVNVYKASNATDVASFAAPGGTTDIKAKGGYTATEMAAGASLQITPRTNLYGELGKLWANGGDSLVKSGVQASIGVKVQW
jgi:outer membrane autotransporter protein